MSTSPPSGAAGSAAPRRALLLAPSVGLAALLVYLALTPLPPFARDVFGSLLRRHLILGLIFLGYTAWLTHERRLPRRTPLDVPLAALLVAIALAVLRSTDRRVSVEAVASLLPAFVLFRILIDLQSMTARSMAVAAVAAAATVALVALWSVWQEWRDWLVLVRAIEGGVHLSTLLPPSTPRVEGVGNHPNILGGFFAMALPPALALATVSRGWRRSTLVCAGLLTVVALFFTLSRTAWLAAIAGCSVTAVGAFSGRWGNVRVNRRAGVAVVVGAGALLIVALAILQSGARPEWLFRDSLGARADQRAVGWTIFRGHKLTGVGPGLYPALYPLYSRANPFAAVHSHNIVVQTAVDTGVLGLLAGGGLLLGVARLAVDRFRRGVAGERIDVAAAVGALTAFGAHALGDAPQLFPETGLLAVVALAALCRVAEQEKSRSAHLGVHGTAEKPLAANSSALRRTHQATQSWRAICEAGKRVRVTALLAPLSLLLLLPASWLYSDRAHADYARGITAARRADWNTAVRAQQRAVEHDRTMPAYWFALGAAHAFAAIAGDRQAEQRAALAALQRGLELEPHNGAALVNYAALNVALGQPEAARQSLPALGRLAGGDSLLLLAQATLTQWTAPPEQAIESYAGLLALNPTLAATPFWRDDAFRAANFERIVDRALARAPEVAGEGAGGASLRRAIALYAGRPAPPADTLRAALAANPNDIGLQVATGKLLAAAGATQTEGIALLEGVVRSKGDDPAARAALGDAYAAAGDQSRARRQWLAATYLGDLGASVALGDSYPAPEVPRAVSEQAERLLAAAETQRFYLIFQSFRFTFQRAEPVPIILPGDWLDALPAQTAEWRADIERWRR